MFCYWKSVFRGPESDLFEKSISFVRKVKMYGRTKDVGSFDGSFVCLFEPVRIL